MRDDVQEGYQEGDWPEEHDGDRELRPYEDEMLQALSDRLDDEANVLDLGCGTGLPYDWWLADSGYQVTGVDFVAENLAHARENVPSAEFIEGDFTDLEYDSAFDAVVSFYAVFHIPRDEHQGLFEDIHSWLRDDGHLLITIAAGELDRHTDEFLGGEITWSQYSPEKTKKMLEDAGFTIQKTVEEKREDEHHIWILAQAT